LRAGGCGDDLHVSGRLEDEAEPGPYKLFVVHDDHPYRVSADVLRRFGGEVEQVFQWSGPLRK
jgi:hypothetical protein